SPHISGRHREGVKIDLLTGMSSGPFIVDGKISSMPLFWIKFGYLQEGSRKIVPREILKVDFIEEVLVGIIAAQEPISLASFVYLCWWKRHS
ncbi:hypothetical protein N9908_05670, partial [Akkermansiaceae bacterium]|nr:hypothetical protein [Akkermansiaceae bacterium]